MKIRQFNEKDTPSLINLFRKTVHTVCKKDYSPAQLNAWAPEVIDATKWYSRLSQSYTIVAEINTNIVGFSNLNADGYIDMLFVDANYQGQKIASTLLGHLLEKAKLLKFERIYSDVSITARPFFISQGFDIQEEYEKKIGEIVFQNAIMKKEI
jgi:putative acetyltransferase